MDIDVLLLAAGEGRRIAPYHRVRPKALLPVLARPLLAHTLERLAGLPIGRCVVVAAPAFATDVAGAASGHAAQIVVQERPAGTADAVRCGLAALPGDSHVLVLYADCFLDPDDLRRLAAPLPDGLSGRVLTAPLGRDRSQDWICAEPAAGPLAALWGHPRQGRARIGGAFLLSRQALALTAEVPSRGVRVEVGGMPPPERDLCEAINLGLERGLRFEALACAGPSADLDKPWHLLAANRIAVEAAFAGRGGPDLAPDARCDAVPEAGGRIVVEAGGRVEAGVVVRGRLWVGVGSVVRQGAICEGDVVLGRNVRLEDYAKVENCVIGDRSVVSHCAEILGGVLMRNVWLMHHCEIYGVLGDDVDVGAATVCGTLRFDDGDTAHRVAGRWEVPDIGANAAYLGDHVRTGVNVTILPGRHVGPYSALGPGLVVAEDVPERTQVTVRQQTEMRPFGPERYGW